MVGFFQFLTSVKTVKCKKKKKRYGMFLISNQTILFFEELVILFCLSCTRICVKVLRAELQNAEHRKLSDIITH